MNEGAAEDRHQCHTDPGDVEAARVWLRQTLGHHGVASDIQRDLTLAFTEIVTNILPRVDGRPAEDKVELQLGVTDTSVRLSVVDASPPFEPGPDSDEDGEGGVGLLLLHLLADEVSIGPGASGGSVTTVVKNRADD
jgi:anti-sigma regulatory factor (Ser/Thr protein kinase)